MGYSTWWTQCPHWAGCQCAWMNGKLTCAPQPRKSVWVPLQGLGPCRSARGVGKRSFAIPPRATAGPEIWEWGGNLRCIVRIAPVITAAFGPPGVPTSKLVSYLANTHKIKIAGGLGLLKDRIIRIGHMSPTISEVELDLVLLALNDFMVHESREVSCTRICAILELPPRTGTV